MGIVFAIDCVELDSYNIIGNIKKINKTKIVNKILEGMDTGEAVPQNTF